jgi:hypothetical protein
MLMNKLRLTGCAWLRERAGKTRLLQVGATPLKKTLLVPLSE